MNDSPATLPQVNVVHPQWRLSGAVLVAWKSLMPPCHRRVLSGTDPHLLLSACRRLLLQIKAERAFAGWQTFVTGW